MPSEQTYQYLPTHKGAGNQSTDLGWQLSHFLQVQLIVILLMSPTLEGVTRSFQSIPLYSLGFALTVPFIWVLFVKKRGIPWHVVFGTNPPKSFCHGFIMGLREPMPVVLTKSMVTLVKFFFKLGITVLRLQWHRWYAWRGSHTNQKRDTPLEGLLARARETLNTMATILPNGLRTDILETANDTLYRRCRRPKDVPLVTTIIAIGMVKVFLKEHRLYAEITLLRQIVLQRAWGAVLGISAMVSIASTVIQFVPSFSKFDEAIVIIVLVPIAGTLGWLSTRPITDGT